jgi:hypothetical protein
MNCESTLSGLAFEVLATSIRRTGSSRRDQSGSFHDGNSTTHAAAVT